MKKRILPVILSLSVASSMAAAGLVPVYASESAPGSSLQKDADPSPVSAYSEGGSDYSSDASDDFAIDLMTPGIAEDRSDGEGSLTEGSGYEEIDPDFGYDDFDDDFDYDDSDPGYDYDDSGIYYDGDGEAASDSADYETGESADEPSYIDETADADSFLPVQDITEIIDKDNSSPDPEVPEEAAAGKETSDEEEEDIKKETADPEAQAVGDIYLNDHVFPDPNFFAYIRSLFPDKEFNAIVSEKEREEIKEMNCSGLDIENLEGIQNFEYLEKLDCSQNQITSLNLNACMFLNDLNCSGNQIEELNPGCLPSVVTFLNCSYNPLTSLDVNECIFLKKLDCSGNQIEELNCSGNPIEELDCSGNQLTELNSGCLPTSLLSLNCSWNPLISLDVSSCTSLQTIDCSWDRLLSLDVSGLSDLESLSCGYNQYSVVDKNGTVSESSILKSLNVRGCTSLEKLSCESNEIGQLDLTDCTALKELNCESNKLKEITGLGGCTGLTSLICSLNELEGSLDVSGFSSLTNLSCADNGFTSLNAAGLSNLCYLDCNGDKLETLNVANCTKLESLNCFANYLTALDVSTCTALTYLNCDDNELESLNAGGLSQLTDLYCSMNKIETLNLSGCSELKYLDCSTNKLKSLTVADPAKLYSLNCYDNELEYLNLSGCSALTVLSCGSNYLTSLNLKDCPSLKTLGCEINDLETLDLRYCPDLLDLCCTKNNFTSLDLNSCPGLQVFICNESKYLKTVNLENCHEIFQFECYENPALTSLDLTPSSGSLLHLEIDNNPSLSDLNIIDCYGLKEFYCYDNAALTTLYVYGCDALINLVNSAEPVKAGTVIKYTSDKTGNYFWFDEDLDVINDKRTPSLSFSKDTVNKVFGNAAFTFTPSVKETDGTLSWSSSNKAVATVDQKTGKVTIKGAGSARITVKASEGRFYNAGSASYVLKVNKADNVIKASNIKKTTASAAQKIEINPRVKVSTALTYKSNNSSIRVSSKGVVTIPKYYVGSATITITGKATANYKAVTKKITVTVLPKSTSLTKLTNKSGKILQASWKRNSRVTGYQIEYSTKKDFSSYKLVTIKKNTVTTTSIKNKIQKGKTYYVRIRTYKTVGGKNYYSAWSKALARKVVR
ncbi:MAG: Ig-like domain-containing protein [Eubacterium sp.]|nr:Ig-like domain-containing protein [Eubacterium sp.]